MPIEIELVPGEAGAAAVESLQALVYPPEMLKTWVGRDVTWAHAFQRVLVREAKGGPVLSHVGVFVREIEWDGLPVTIGGIGAVMTHPGHRRQGHARAALRRALTYLHDEAKVAFALLFVEPPNVHFYANQGWHRFEGEVWVKQPDGVAPFTQFGAMTLGIRHAAGATRGKIDLRGLPW
jgi:GNAT superfamily N-acetyltransferase